MFKRKILKKGNFQNTKYILGYLRGDSVQKVISCGKMPHWTKWPWGFDSSHSKLHWLQPLQFEKRKRNAHSLGLLRGIKVQKSHFVRFKKHNSRREFFNQIKSVCWKSAKFQINSGNNKQRTCQSCTNEPYGNFGQSKYMGQIPSNAPPPL